MEEKKMTRITDQEIYKAIEDVRTEKEGSIGKALITQLAVALDTRVFIRKLYKDLIPTKRIVTDPTKARKGDVVVGKE